MLTILFFAMIITQSIAYFWFQSKGGVVSHRDYITAHALFMIGQSAQALDSFRGGAWASFSIAAFYFCVTSVGIFQRYRLMRRGASD
jgi:uncharacterized membrane protein